MSSLQYGVGMFPTESMSRIIHLSKQAEELGYSHIWVGDSHLIWREAFVNMAAVALNTSKVIIGTGVTNPVTRHPSVLASGYATLDELAPGRFAVGIGLGDSSLETMGRKQARLAEFEAAVAQMRAVIEGGEAELESGSKIHLNFAQNRKIPFYAAASGPKMLELSGRIADGVIILVGVDSGAIERAVERIAAGAESAGRKLSDIDLVLWVPCAVSEQPGAKDAVKAHVARVIAHPLPFTLDEQEQKVLDDIHQAYNYYQHMNPLAAQARVIPDWLVDKFAVAGTPDECNAKVEELKQSAINQVAIIPYNVGDADRGETLRLFAGAM
ncbi:MAG: LLM class flavin-dependent oxidoreductase [Deltaproteobacteria bacterium]|nr:LLM class flavin-dependent oxidoreductase [Deltaproteobacteria bacterium]